MLDVLLALWVEISLVLYDRILQSNLRDGRREYLALIDL